jgi:transposase
MLETVFDRCCGLDVHQKSVSAWVLITQPDGSVKEARQRFKTTTAALEDLARWLAELAVEQVVMESTGVYWKPVFNVLDGQFDVWLVNACHVAQVPGRKTDDGDARWLAKLMRFGLLRRSFIPDVDQRDLRELTRYRTRLIGERSAAANRLRKVLEDSNIKLGSVVSDIQGVSARLMLEALIADEETPEQMAQLARGRLRSKIPELVEALTGHSREHHRFLLQEILTHLDNLNARIEAVSQRIARAVEVHRDIIMRLVSIPGVNQRTVEVILAEIGSNVDPFPSDKHLASWTCLCPGNDVSANKRRSGRTRRGQKWLRPALMQAAWAASRTKDTYLAAQFHRIRARRGAKRAAVAVAHSIVTSVYHLLDNPEAVYQDLGGDYFLNRNEEAVRRRAIKHLETLGYQVSLTEAEN